VSLLHRRLTGANLRELVDAAPEPAALDERHRRSLTSRFAMLSSRQHRRLDAWTVERAGAASSPFAWSPTSARRIVGNAALRRAGAVAPSSLADAVGDELTDQLLRAAAGYARPGSLATWLADQPPAVLGLVRAEACTWAVNLVEALHGVGRAWRVAPADAYYDVAGARTTLRARRDVVVERDGDRVTLRVRSGSPGRSAGPGLRADLAVDALADPRGVASARLIGLWPEAGVCLAVDGAMGDLRAGARGLLRAAIARARQPLEAAA
jgi:hypothetical protein